MLPAPLGLPLQPTVLSSRTQVGFESRAPSALRFDLVLFLRTGHGTARPPLAARARRFTVWTRAAASSTPSPWCAGAASRALLPSRVTAASATASSVCTCIVRVVMLMIVLQTLTMGLNAWPSSGACGGPQGLTLVPPSLGQSPSQNLLGCSQAVSCTTPPATTESGSLLAACVRGDAAWRTSRRMHAQVVDDPAGRRGGRASNCHRRDRVPSDRVLLDARHTL